MKSQKFGTTVSIYNWLNNEIQIYGKLLWIEVTNTFFLLRW